MKTIAVLLAAGNGSRFLGPGHKLNQRLGAHTIAELAIDHARRAGIGPVIVVTGATHLDTSPVQVDDDADPDVQDDVQIVDNPRWADGQSTSLQVAIETARSLAADAIVVGLADQPFIPPSAWRAVAASTAPIAVATYSGQRGHPVRLATAMWEQLPLTGDIGARDLIRLQPDLVERIPCEGRSADIDTWEDLLRWQSKSSTSSP